MIVANILQNYKNVLFPGDTFEFSAQDQSDCFSSAFYEENCKSECAHYQISLWSGQACDQTAVKFTRDVSGVITVDTSTPFIESLCV
jgi:hypothetical protein